MGEPGDCGTCGFHAEMERRVSLIDSLTEQHADLLRRHVEALDALREALQAMRSQDVENRVHMGSLRQALDDLAAQLKEKAKADLKRDTDQARETARIEGQLEAVKGELRDAARAGAKEGSKVSFWKAVGLFFGSPLALLALWAILYALGVPVPAPAGTAVGGQ